MAVCPLIRGIRVVGKSIAKMEIFVALEIPCVVLMDGNAVETLVCGRFSLIWRMADAQQVVLRAQIVLHRMERVSVRPYQLANQQQNQVQHDPHLRRKLNQRQN